MFCPRCGKQIDDGSAFCPSCGSELHKSVANKSGNASKKKKSKKPLVIGLAAVVLVVVIAGIAYGALGAGKAQGDPLAGTWTASVKSTNADGSDYMNGEATLAIKDSNAEVDAHVFLGTMEFWGKIRGNLQLEGVQDGARVYSIRAQEAEWQAHDATFSSDEIVNTINACGIKLYVPDEAFGDHFGAGSWGLQITRSADYGTFSDTMLLALYASDEAASQSAVARFGSLSDCSYEEWQSGAGRMSIFYDGSWDSSVQKSLFGETRTAHIELANLDGYNPTSVSIEVVKK